MWDSDDIVYLVVAIAVVALFIAGVALYENASCVAKTSEIGFSHRWDIIGGCMIEVEQDKWIPLEAYYFKQE